MPFSKTGAWLSTSHAGATLTEDAAISDDAATLQIPPEIAEAFLVTARCGCFTQAARSLNLKSSVLRKQLALLEETLQVPLLRFQDNTLTLSRAGLDLQTRLTALNLARNPVIVDQPPVRVVMAESILHDIVQRDLIALLRRNARVRLEVVSLDGSQALQSFSADIALWLAEPGSPASGPGFVTSMPICLARLDYRPHIAKRYSRSAVRPQSLEDLADYMLAERPQDRQQPGLRPWHAFIEQRLFGVVRVHDYGLMLEMIRCSASIGLFPGYMTHLDRGLVALPGIFADAMQLEVWLAVNAQTAHTEAVRLIVDLIINAFRERGEWFE
jgi:DNA-binding transcriptional LysR family regulator